MSEISISDKKTEKHDATATVVSPLFHIASATATKKPTDAEIMLPVAKNIAGTVIAASTV